MKREEMLAKLKERGVEVTETDDGMTFKHTESGYKLVAVLEKDAVESMANNFWLDEDFVYSQVVEAVEDELLREGLVKPMRIRYGDVDKLTSAFREMLVMAAEVEAPLARASLDDADGEPMVSFVCAMGENAKAVIDLVNTLDEEDEVPTEEAG